MKLTVHLKLYQLYVIYDVIMTSWVSHDESLTSNETLASSTSAALSTMLLISLVPTFWNKWNYRGSQIIQKIIEQKIIFLSSPFSVLELIFNFLRVFEWCEIARIYHHVICASRDMSFTWSRDKEAKNRFKNRELTPNLDPVWYAWMHFLECRPIIG